MSVSPCLLHLPDGHSIELIGLRGMQHTAPISLTSFPVSRSKGFERPKSILRLRRIKFSILVLVPD